MRGNGFPDPPAPTGVDPLEGVVPAGAPVVLYVGRIAAEKGVEHLLEAARRLPAAHVVLAGPDDRHGTMDGVRAALVDPATHGRVHVLPPTPGPPYDLYRRADVFVLASGGENFGLVAAEAAAVGTPVVVSDRTGVASAFEEGEALVVAVRRGRDRGRDRACPRRRGAARAARRGRAARGRSLDVGRRRRRSRSRSTARRSTQADAAQPRPTMRRTTASRFSMLGS